MTAQSTCDIERMIGWFEPEHAAQFLDVMNVAIKSITWLEEVVINIYGPYDTHSVDPSSKLRDKYHSFGWIVRTASRY